MQLATNATHILTTPFPLSSRRMKVAYLRKIAEGLELPVDDLRQMIDGKLCDMDHQPSNVQVSVKESTLGEIVQLLHAYGVFLEVKNRQDDLNSTGQDDDGYSLNSQSTPSLSGSHTPAPGGEALRKELQMLQGELHTLQGERAELRDQVQARS